MEALTVQLQDVGSAALYCPHEAPTRGVVSCTYEQWFGPYSLRRRYCHLPVSGRGMQRFLQFRLGCHSSPVAAGRLAAKLWLVLLMLTGLTGCAWLAIVVLWGLRCTWFLSVLPLLLYGLGMRACSQVAQTP